MTSDQLRQLYEKLYFQEVDARDKLQTRLQIPLTLILSVIGALVFLLQNFDYQIGSWTAFRVAFLFFLLCGAVILVLAMKWFVNALYNNEYHFLPDSAQTAKYKELLEQTYESYGNKDALVSDAMDKYVLGYYVQFAALNTQVNDRRAAYIHLCNGGIIASAVLFVAAFLAFYFGELDKGRIKPASEVVITKPIDVRIQENRR
jgi:hypothetical protein